MFIEMLKWDLQKFLSMKICEALWELIHSEQKESWKNKFKTVAELWQSEKRWFWEQADTGPVSQTRLHGLTSLDVNVKPNSILS